MNKIDEAIRAEKLLNDPTLKRALKQMLDGIHDVIDNLPDDEKRRVLVTGLRALDGREDLEIS